MVAAIYRITNTVNGKVYIGKTVDVARRWSQHRVGLRTGNYLGRTSKDMCADAATHGHEAFVFEILQTFDDLDHEAMDAAEIGYLLEYQSIDPSRGYNRSAFIHSSRDTAERHKIKREKKEAHRLARYESGIGLGRHRIMQYDLSGNLIFEWPSIKFLCDKFPGRITRQGVQQSSKDPKRTYKGYRWKMVSCKK